MDEPGIGLRFIVAALATWRVAHLLAFEDGPFAFVARLRKAAGRFGGVLDCFYCLSLWVAAPLALWVSTSPVAWVCVTLGASGAACLVDRLTGHPVVMQPLSEGEADGMLRTEARGGGELDSAREPPGGAAASLENRDRSIAR